MKIRRLRVKQEDFDILVKSLIPIIAVVMMVISYSVDYGFAQVLNFIIQEGKELLIGLAAIVLGFTIIVVTYKGLSLLSYCVAKLFVKVEKRNR